MSIEEVRADVIIDMDARDNASPKIRTAAEKINMEYRKMRMEQRAVGAQFELNNRGFVQTMRSMQTIGHLAQRGIALWQSYTLSQMRLRDALKDVRDVQRELQEAIASGDEEAQKRLLEDEIEARERLKQAQRDNIINYILMGTVAAGSASTVVTKVIPQLARLRASFRSTTLQVQQFNRAMSGAPTTTSRMPSTTAQTSQAARATTTTQPRTSAPRIGPAGSVGLGGLSILAGGIINEVMNAEDPLERLKEIILDPFNFRGEKRDQIIISVRVGNETKQQVIDLHNPYVVE